MKERCRREGMDSFQEHEVLEYLLFYAIPYRDTNDLAHRLLQRFGNLAGVFGASYEDLLIVSGMGPNAAMLLSSIPQVTRYYEEFCGSTGAFAGYHGHGGLIEALVYRGERKSSTYVLNAQIGESRGETGRGLLERSGGLSRPSGQGSLAA